MLNITRLSGRGQIVVPKQIREKLKIKNGTVFEAKIVKGAVVFRIVKGLGNH